MLGQMLLQDALLQNLRGHALVEIFLIAIGDVRSGAVIATNSLVRARVREKRGQALSLYPRKPEGRLAGCFVRHPLASELTPGSFKRTPGSFKRTPGSLKRTPGSLKRTPGPLLKDPGPLKRTPVAVRIGVQGGPRQSRGPGGRFRLKTQENRSKNFPALKGL